jgi:hypothetical protein
MTVESEDEVAPETAKRLDCFKALGFFPADHASAESGKIYANGAYWNVLRFPEFPAILPAMALVAVLRQPFQASLADHTFEMTMQDSDGKDLPPLRVEGQFRASLSPESKYGDAGVVPIAVPVHGVRFEHQGSYAFVFAVDGKELARYPFEVIQVFAARASGGQARK